MCETRPIDAIALEKLSVETIVNGELTEIVYLKDIKNAPTFDTDRRGVWIPQTRAFVRYRCSRCGGMNHGGFEKYCPDCGAKMDGVRYE